MTLEPDWADVVPNGADKGSRSWGSSTNDSMSIGSEGECSFDKVIAAYSDHIGPTSK